MQNSLKRNPVYSGHPLVNAKHSNFKDELKPVVIKPAKLKFVALFLFVSKKDYQLRYSVKYCKLQEMSLENSVLLPCMNDCTNSLEQEEILTTLEAYSDS